MFVFGLGTRGFSKLQRHFTGRGDTRAMQRGMGTNDNDAFQSMYILKQKRCICVGIELKLQGAQGALLAYNPRCDTVHQLVALKEDIAPVFDLL